MKSEQDRWIRVCLVVFLMLQGWVQAVEPVVAPDNRSGTVDFPVLDAPFTNGTRVRKGMQDLKTLAQDIRVEVQSIKNNSRVSFGPGGDLGGNRFVCDATAVVVVEAPGGFNREVEVLVSFVGDTDALAPSGDEQQFGTALVHLEGEITGDPDFDLLRLTGGSDFGLPSPGQTTLTRLPSGDFAVDSFFDITYQIEFDGAPGGALDGLEGTTTETARCEQPLKLFHGLPYETTGDATAVLSPDGVRYGGGGGGGVIRLATESFSLNYEEIKWSYDLGADGSGPGLGLPDDGDTLTLGVHIRELDKSSTKLCESVCGTSGGESSCAVDFSALGASGTRVEIWHDGQLAGSAFAPNGTPAFSVSAEDFQLHSVLVVGGPGEGKTGATRRRRGDVVMEDIVVVKELDKSSPKVCTTPGGQFSGSEIRLYPVGVRLRTGAIGHVDHGCTKACVIADSSVRVLGAEVRAVGDAALHKADSKRDGGRLKVSNLGSSGCDGVSVDLGDGGRPPVLVEIEELVEGAAGGGGSGGAVFLYARAAAGDPLGSVRMTAGGGGGGGRVVFADFSSVSSSTALVRVYDDDSLVGEAQVVLSGETEVASLGDGPDGASRVRACGKNEQLPPFQFPCFFAEFDRQTVFTPAGTTDPLSGNRIEVLADGAQQGLAELRFFEVLSDSPSPLVVSSISHEPGELPPWIWAPMTNSSPPAPSAPIPSSVSVVCGSPAEFDTGASSGQAPGEEGLEFRLRISELVETGPSPIGGTEYACAVEIAASGMGSKKGYDYYQHASASCVISVGTNEFPDEDVQQIPIELVSLDLSFPPPSPPQDADFDLLRVRCGSGQGMDDCPGELLRRRLPDGNFQVDSFFDITYRIDFEGASGGPLAGASGDEGFSSRWPMYRSQFIRWGLPHEALGAADLSRSTSGALTVSNLGSSGCDGVSVDFGGAQGGTIVFEPHSMLPGASMRLEAVGDALGLPVSSSLGHVLLARSSGVDSFFDIFYDLSFGGGTETCVQVLNEGSVVSEVVVPAAAGALRLDPLQAGADPPAVRACGKLPGLGGPSCYFIVFGGSGMISPPDGSDPVQGDEVRMLELEVRVNRIEMARCFFTDDDPWDIQRSSIVMHGRNVLAEDGTLVRCWDGSCRVSPPGCPSSTPYRCPDGSCSISALQCPEPPALDALSVSVSPRDAARGMPTGKRQHKPLSVSTGGLVLGSPGQSLRLEVDGTAGGANQGIGVLDVTHSGGELLTSVQWPYQLSAGTRVLVRESPLYQESGNTGENPLYEGVAAPGNPPVRIDASTPILLDVCGGAPGDNNPLNRPAYMSMSFADPVSITAPDGATYEGREVIFIPEGQSLPPVSAVQRLTLSGVTEADWRISSVFTGPDWHTGLSHQSLGSCSLETDSSGQLVVSNIGSSGLDGVAIDMQQGEGGRFEWLPIEVTGPDAELQVGVRPHSDHSDHDLSRNDRAVDLAITSNNDGSSCRVWNKRKFAEGLLVCRAEDGAVVGEFELPAGDLGSCSSAAGGAVRVRVCGWDPPQLSSLGNTDAGPYVVFDEPVTFHPSSGGAVVCSSFHVLVHCDDPAVGYCESYRDGDYSCVCLLANMQDQILLSSSVCHFRNCPHSGLGEARLRADASPDALVVSNIGSSGEDGVSIDLGQDSSFSVGGATAGDRMSESVSLNFERVQLHYGGGGGGGRIALGASGSFDPNGGTSVPLGSCALDTDSDNDSIPMEADFSDFGTDLVRVVLLQDGEMRGEFVHDLGLNPGAVASLREEGGVASGVTGCGKLPAEQIPGGWQPPCFVWTFDQPVSVTPPGGDPASGIVGTEMRVLAHGASGPPLAGLDSFEVRFTSLPPVTLTGRNRNDLLQWWSDNFSPAEIDLLAAQNFAGDFDGDGCPDVCEAVHGTDPRVRDASGSQTLGSSVAPGAAGEQHLVLRYLTGDVDGFDIVLRSSPDLKAWNDDVSQYRLLERNLMPDNRTEWLWEVVAPIGSRASEFHGHVTVLK